jgi:hypothetical protein
MADKDNRTITLVHDGGARKYYSANVVGGRIYVHVPLSQDLTFSPETGRCTSSKKMACWKLLESDRVALHAIAIEQKADAKRTGMNRLGS